MKTIIALTTIALGLAAGSAFADESPRAKAYGEQNKPVAAASFLGGPVQAFQVDTTRALDDSIYGMRGGRP